MALRLALIIIALCAAAAFAQDQPASQHLSRVDQAVGDLDPLATSIRRVQVGLGVDGYQSTLYRVAPADPLNLNAPSSQQSAYIRLSPGITAQVDRIDYVVRRGRKGTALNVAPLRDGEYFEMVPANTVFVLSPIAPINELNLGPDYRINARIDTKLDLRVDGRAYQSPAIPVAGARRAPGSR